MFDVVYREETLLNVIRSVTRNGRSIVLTAVLALILVYMFSIVGFMFFRDDFLVTVDEIDQPETGEQIISLSIINSLFYQIEYLYYIICTYVLYMHLYFQDNLPDKIELNCSDDPANKYLKGLKITYSAKIFLYICID